MLAELVRGRLRVPILSVMIICLLGVGVGAWANRRDTTTKSTDASGNGAVVPTDQVGSLAPASATGAATVATGGTTSSTAQAGHIRVAAGAAKRFR